MVLQSQWQFLKVLPAYLYAVFPYVQEDKQKDKIDIGNIHKFAKQIWRNNWQFYPDICSFYKKKIFISEIISIPNRSST